jgi:hypothetical protein
MNDSGQTLTELRDLRRGKVTVMETGSYIEKLNEKHFVSWAQVVRIDAKKPTPSLETQ